MRKTLLTLASAFTALAASAQGIVSVGANIAVVPSVTYSKQAYTAKTLVFNSHMNYGGGQTENPFYNELFGVPADDANGKAWYELGYDESTLTLDEFITASEELAWEEHTAPFSSDAKYNGLDSYQWIQSEIMGDIYIRRTFSTDQLLSGDVYLACGHDDAPCEYYINGVLVWSRTGWEIDHWNFIYDEETGEKIDSTASYKNGWNNNEFVKLTDEQKNLIRLGGEENLLAVHVHQNWGGAFADCGLYTSVEGGLEMGYVNSWDGKVLFNNYGGYNFNGNNDPHPLHNWEKLYEAKEGDVYTVHMESASEPEMWGSQMHFKSPIVIEEDHEYTVKMTLEASCEYGGVTFKLTDNDDDNIVAFEELHSLYPDEAEEIEGSIEGMSIKNLKIALDFGGGEAGSTIKISNISVYDDTAGKELWVGGHFFNYFYMTNAAVDENGDPVYSEETGEQVINEVKWPEVEGRVETLAWTLPDFDDEMWETWAMPVGNAGYGGIDIKTVWPGGMGHYDYGGDGNEGQNTNLWVRRTFEMDKVNERLSYALNVCHDDNYETYVNGHLLQKNTGWTNGKNPVQVHIPAKYLNVGKNVIATYIQQNWGGRFYDCGINVEEVNYQECSDALKAVIAKAEGEHAELTQAMRDTLAAYAAAGKYELETNLDAAEIKEYAKNLEGKVNAVLAYAGTVTTMRETIALCEKEKDNGYLTTVLPDVKLNLDTCATADQVNPMLTKLRVARKRNAAERRTEKFVGSQPEPEGEYYIYNVGDKRFLGGGESWGAHQVTEYESNAFRLDPYKNDGTELPQGFYRIETFRSNGTTGEGYTMDYMNYGGYVDTSTDDAWEFIPVEGKENVFHIVRASEEYEETLKDVNGNDSVVVRHSNTREDGSRYYLGLRDGDNAHTVGFNNWNVIDTDMKTPELETNQWMLITLEEREAMLAKATEDNPADATFLIENPGYDQRLSIDNWYCEAVGGGTGVWGRGNNYVDFVYEGWNTEYYDLSQTIYDPKPGLYKISVQGYYRDGHYTTHMRKVAMGEEVNNFGYVYAMTEEGWITEGDEPAESTQICSFSDGINMVPGMGRLDDFEVTYTDEEGNEQKYKGAGTMRATDACWSAAEEYFQNGLYKNFLTIYVPEGAEVLKFGVYKTDEARNDGDWLVVDNWRLTYYGEDADPTAIGSVEDTAAPKGDGGIYNLAGQKLQKTLKGVNIVNGRKIVVK